MFSLLKSVQKPEGSVSCFLYLNKFKTEMQESHGLSLSLSLSLRLQYLDEALMFSLLDCLYVIKINGFPVPCSVCLEAFKIACKRFYVLYVCATSNLSTSTVMFSLCSNISLLK
jgi:hypothetical protein